MCSDLIFLNHSFSCHLLKITFLEHGTTTEKENNAGSFDHSEDTNISSILRARVTVFSI
jgi:hypothetical protein